MFKKNKYGTSTATPCVNCGRTATTKNTNGMPTCIYCKGKSISRLCPVCQQELDNRIGKYGAYFFCWKCNVNWSISKLSDLQ